MNRKKIYIFFVLIVLGIVLFIVFLSNNQSPRPIISPDGTAASLDLSNASPHQIALGQAINFRFPYISDLSEYQKIFGVSDSTFLFGFGLDPYQNALPGAYLEQSSVVDAFGYPVRQTFLHTQVQNMSRSSAGFEKVARLLVPQKVQASTGVVILGTYYMHDSDFPGLYHCKDSSEDQSYFIVYFEDVALLSANEAGAVGFADTATGIQKIKATCDVFVEYDHMLKMNDMEVPVTPSIVFYRFENHMPPQALANASSFYLDFEDNFSHTFLQQHITKGIPNIPGIWNFDGYIDVNHTIPWSF